MLNMQSSFLYSCNLKPFTTTGIRLKNILFGGTVIFTIPRNVDLLNVDFNVSIWADVDALNTTLMYSSAKAAAHYTIYDVRNGTIVGAVTGADAGYTVTATDTQGNFRMTRR